MRWWIACGIVSIWLALFTVAEAPWLRWQTKAGSAPVRLETWPAESAIPRESPGLLVTLFVHPKCPCTTTSLRLLEQAVEEHEDVRWLVVAWRPQGSDWKPETTLPVFIDEGGAETKRFGVTTSGHVIAFDARGSVVFSGGLTDLRGASEAGEGVPLLEASLQRGAFVEPRTPVFGCRLAAR
jgi:hypothetical protein